MNPEIDVTIYNADQPTDVPSLWYAERRPQGIDAQVDLVHAM